MFRALLAHPQETIHSGSWYTACVLCLLAAPNKICSCQSVLRALNRLEGLFSEPYIGLKACFKSLTQA
jgi:hypothetical protein